LAIDRHLAVAPRPLLATAAQRRYPKILRKARKGTRVVLYPGNHDEFVSDFHGEFGNIAIQKHAIHQTADGRRILVIHGHELDTVVQNVRWLAFAGDVVSNSCSRSIVYYFVRRHFGLGYWSLSAYAKQRVKNAVNFIGKFEAAVVKYAEGIRSTLFSADISTALRFVTSAPSPITTVAIGSKPVRHDRGRGRRH